MFAPLSTYELRQLARLLRVQVLPGGSVVYKQGTVGNDLYIIRSGYVRLLKQVWLAVVTFRVGRCEGRVRL